MKKSHLMLGLTAGGLLLAAVGLQFWAPGRPSESPGKGVHLAEIFPGTLSGRPARELELGSTENVRAAVEKTLRYDDVLFREYRLKDAVISVYVAYWGPGRMPTQLVASHTPDRCWTENGWTCEQSRHQVNAGVTAVTLLPAEWRLFKAPTGQRLNVVFWHLVGREVYDYDEGLNQSPSVWRWWRDVASQAVKTPSEQYFIRVTSDIPFEKLAGDRDWNQLLESLGRLGLENGMPAAKP